MSLHKSKLILPVIPHSFLMNIVVEGTGFYFVDYLHLTHAFIAQILFNVVRIRFASGPAGHIKICCKLLFDMSY